MRGDFFRDLITFAGRRIEFACRRVQPKLSQPVSEPLTEEERSNVAESITHEAIYLTGFTDGMRLRRLVREGRIGDV